MNLKKALLMTLGAGLIVTTTFSYNDVALAEGTFSSDATVEFSASEEATAPLDPINPEEELDPGEAAEGNVTGDSGPLSFDYVSNIDFGNQVVDVEGGTYQADGNVEHIQVTDGRGPANGWNVIASVAPFNNDGEPSLPGAQIVLTDGEAVSTSSSTPPNVTSDIVLDTEGDPVQIANATGGEREDSQGLGTWVIRWLDNDSEEPVNENVSLVVPAASATAGQHSTTINWTLTNGPGN